MTQMGWVHMHSTSKRIELESPGCSGFEGNKEKERERERKREKKKEPVAKRHQMVSGSLALPYCIFLFLF